MHLLAQFAAKEMMNSVASSLRFQGRKGRKMLSRTPRGKGLASSGFTSFSLVMIWETEKNITCQCHWSCAIRKGPTGHTEGSNRGNSEILANLSQDSCKKIILVGTWGRRQGEAGECPSCINTGWTGRTLCPREEKPQLTHRVSPEDLPRSLQAAK